MQHLVQVSSITSSKTFVAGAWACVSYVVFGTSMARGVVPGGVLLLSDLSLLRSSNCHVARFGSDVELDEVATGRTRSDCA